MRTYREKTPTIHPSAWIDESAQVIGEVYIGPDSSVWCQAVLRGDINWIRIGARTNLQDGVIVHVSAGAYGVTIEDEVTIGHRAVIHGCRIQTGCLIGMGAIILDGADIGAYAIIGAGALVTEGQQIPPQTLALGVPAKVARPLRTPEIEELKARAARYVELKNSYQHKCSP